MAGLEGMIPIGGLMIAGAAFGGNFNPMPEYQAVIAAAGGILMAIGFASGAVASTDKSPQKK